MVVTIQFLSYLACGGAFTFLAILVALSRTGGRYKYLLLVCCIVTVLWSLTVVGASWIGNWPWANLTLNVARNIAWLVLLAALLGIRHIRDAGHMTWLAAGIVAIVSLGIIFAEPVSRLIWTEAPRQLLTFISGGHVLLSVIGLLALENLYRNAEPKVRWAIKYFCFGLGTILGFDFFLFADAALFGRVDPTFFNARGFVGALVSPLLAISISRATLWEIDIHVR